MLACDVTLGKKDHWRSWGQVLVRPAKESTDGPPHHSAVDHMALTRPHSIRATIQATILPCLRPLYCSS
ncbi:Uncharacterized protein HZ326_12395 [Fusarium oxysporum f. sp. albedinis]|nr:Uncharacterized protein HZ326_12395 [Fusarium oxysporum f. sp. albedinis]